MKAEQIEQMRINSRRNGINPKSWYHAGAEDMQDAMVEKACTALESILAEYRLCGADIDMIVRDLEQAMED